MFVQISGEFPEVNLVRCFLCVTA